MEDKLTQRYKYLGIFCIYTLFGFSIIDYVLLLAVLLKDKIHTYFMSPVIILIFFFFFLHMMSKIKLPWKLFGLTMKGARRSINESLVATVIICVIITLLKWALIAGASSLHKVHLFEINEVELNYGIFNYALLSLLYMIFVPFQAFILHSALQSPLILFLPSKNKKMASILIVSFLFGAIHIQYNFVFAFFVMLVTLEWAYLYFKHRTIIGVCLSHMIVGMYAFNVLDILHITDIISNQLINFG